MAHEARWLTDGAALSAILTSNKRDAERFLDSVKERFELELTPDKTRLIEFGWFALENCRQRS